MVIEKKPSREIIGKSVVTKEGKRMGIVKDIIFETRKGELLQIVITNPTEFALSLNIEKTKAKELLIPYNSVLAIGDFVVVSEEDLI
jgi:sporulation protein YlmC with PRC-barrel domain